MTLPENKRNAPAHQKLDVQKQPQKEWEEYSREERLTNEVAATEPNQQQNSRSRIKNDRLETGGF